MSNFSTLFFKYWYSVFLMFYSTGEAFHWAFYLASCVFHFQDHFSLAFENITISLFDSILYLLLISLFHLALWVFSLGILYIHIFFTVFGYSYHFFEFFVWDFVQVVLIEVVITEWVIFWIMLMSLVFHILFIIAWWHTHLVSLLAESFFLKFKSPFFLHCLGYY